MRAWLVDRFGEPDTVMRLGEAPDPAGEVRVEVRAAGINFFDLLQIRGGYQYKPPFPFIPGAEAAGVREDTGERVMAFPGQACYAERIAVPASRVFPIPATMDFAAAAGFLIVFHTGWFVLHERLRLKPREWLLVHAGASGAGMAAIQLAKALGARVIATASSDQKLEFCLAQGADHAISYNEASWPAQVRELTGGAGVDAVFDPVGGDAFDLSLKCMAAGGRIAIVGFASGRIPSIPANRLLLKNISAVGAIWGAYLESHPGYLADTQTKLLELYHAGAIRPEVRQRYAFTDAVKALQDADRRQIIGKAVLER
jgi:NADPH2:quinone reductase